MQPFAQKDNSPLQLHWWITAGVAGAFFLWCFDLVPRFGAPESGKVAGPETEDSIELLDDELASFDVSETGESGRSSSTGDRSSASDPEHAWLGLNEPSASDARVATNSSGSKNRGAADRSSRRISDSSIAQASYESETNERGGDALGTSESDGSIRHAALSSAQADIRQREPASGNSKSILPADFAEQLREAEALMAESSLLESHAKLSQLYWKFPEFRQELLPSLEQTAATIFTSPDQLFGEPHFVEYGETLESIGKQYEVPWQYLALLNRITPEKLQAGQKLKVVRGPFGAVVDLSTYTLTIHSHGWYVRHYQIGIGRDGKTPIGVFTVKDKLENPEWYDPDGGVVDADDPDNPLGEYWLGLGDHIGIHGTIDPDSIGKAASRGCIHLGDADIEEVFSLLSVGSQVKIRK